MAWPPGRSRKVCQYLSLREVAISSTYTDRKAGGRSVFAFALTLWWHTSHGTRTHDTPEFVYMRTAFSARHAASILKSRRCMNIWGPFRGDIYLTAGCVTRLTFHNVQYYNIGRI